MTFQPLLYVICILMLHVESRQEMLRIILGFHFQVNVSVGKPKQYGRRLHQRCMVMIIVDVDGEEKKKRPIRACSALLVPGCHVVG